MRVGEVAARAGVTVRALRYYDAARLVVPARLPNGYRDYDPQAVRPVQEIRALIELGLSVEETRPFVERLASGHGSGDECPASLSAYRQAIGQLSDRIDRLVRRRDALHAHLEAAANRAIPSNASHEPTRLPEGLPIPFDDDGAAHLHGTTLPSLSLPATDGSLVRLDSLGEGRIVLYVYPLTGRPGVDLPEGWDTIPGAARVYGVSSQTSDYQQELVDRLRLPFAMLSDTGLASNP